MKQLFVLTTLLLGFSALTVTAQRMQQPLDRGVVAVYRSGGRSVTSTGGTGSLISWRKLAQEPEGTTYNVYKRAKGATEFTKMNTTPLKVTNYKPGSLANNTEYAVTAISPEGVEGAMSQPFTYKTQPWPNVWLNIDFDNQVIRRDDYRTKYCWPMDTDGDGECDALVADRLYAGAADSEEGGDTRSSYMSFGYGAMEGHYGIAYLDGIHPSLVMECADRESGGLHHVYVLVSGNTSRKVRIE